MNLCSTREGMDGYLFHCCVYSLLNCNGILFCEHPFWTGHLLMSHFPICGRIVNKYFRIGKFTALFCYVVMKPPQSHRSGSEELIRVGELVKRAGDDDGGLNGTGEEPRIGTSRISSYTRTGEHEYWDKLFYWKQKSNFLLIIYSNRRVRLPLTTLRWGC
jgi:hypothetical protein